MKSIRRFAILLAVVVMVVTFSNATWAEKAAEAKDVNEVVKININTASVEQLAELKLVGPKIAERIIEYREKQGEFKQPEDIMKVKGVGEKVFEVNKDLIAVK